MIDLFVTKCCGMLEINDLSTAKDPAAALQIIGPMLINGNRSVYGKKVPFVTFTGVIRRVTPDHASCRDDDYGQAFMDYITGNNLGVVTQSPEGRNWTGNRLRVWIWQPDYDRLQSWVAYNKTADTSKIEQDGRIPF
jgi:hypothetical protein